MDGWRFATSADVAAAAALTREQGRLGIDTEFMSEGRYRAMLCVVQVVVTDQTFLEYLPKLVWHQDEPLADPVCVPLHAISEAARQSVTA